MKKLIALTLALAMALGCMSFATFAASGDEFDAITLNKIALSLAVGDSETLTATVHDQNLGNVEADITWASSDETVATVSNGTVTAVKAGTATITAVPFGYEEGNTSGNTPLMATCTVKVFDGMAYLASDTSTSKTITQKYQATTAKSYTDVTKVQVSWTVPNITASVSVSKQWNTDTLTWDTTGITDSATGATAEFVFKNLSSVEVNASVSFTAEPAFVNASGKTDKYTESYKVDSVASDKAETLLSSIVVDHDDPETLAAAAPTSKIEYTITPQSGVFTGLTESAENQKFGTYTVTIGKFVAVTGVTLAETKQITIDGEDTLVATVTPSDATTQTVTWSSDNESVATVDQNGKVAAVAIGTAHVTAAADGKSAVCTVTVVKHQITKPTADTTAFTYSGNEQTYTVSADDAYTVTGNKKTNAGTSQVTVSLDDPAKYEWDDGTTADLQYTFTVAKATYNMTGAGWNYTAAFPYDGNEKTVTVTGLPSGVTVKAYTDNAKTDVGTYTAKVTFNYDTTNYNEPTLSDLSWSISHTHTFAATWSSDDTTHWHASTCDHDVTADEAEHDYDDEYICKTCGYEHTHTYETTWSSDETIHWHDSTCGHDVIADEAVHSINETTGDCECGFHQHVFSDTTCGCPCGAYGHEYIWDNLANGYHCYKCSKCGDVVAGTTEEHDGSPCSKCGSECLAKGTKITMADGTAKNVEDIAEGDVVLTFNHEKGVYEGQKVYLAWAGATPKRAFTLHFTNGINLSIIGDHCLFEQESVTYVIILESNAEDFIGHHFYNATAGRYEELLSVSYGEEPVEYYEIYTEYNANCIAENMLNAPMDDSERLRIYAYNQDLTVDGEQLAADIAEFGLFDYPADAEYSYELYDALGWKYVNIMVGKGLDTWEDFNARLDAFLA